MAGLPVKWILVVMLIYLPFVFPSQSLSNGQSISKDILAQWLEKGKEVRIRKIEAVLGKYKTGLSQREKSKLVQLIYEESIQYDFDPELILALVIKESSFYNYSKSRVGALGLMQIRPTTGREMARAIRVPWGGKQTLFDPHLNIKLGTRYLASLHHRFGKLEVALAAYNYGPSRISKMIKRGEPLPKVYAHRILSIYQQFLELGPVELTHSWEPDALKKDYEKNSNSSFQI